MANVEVRPLSKFTGEELQEIMEAIVSGYDLQDWRQTLRFKWGLVLDNLINPHQGFYGVVSDLISWTERKGKTRELLALAFAESPGNENLRQLAIKHELALEDTVLKYGKETPPKPATLEAMVNSHSRLIDYGRFLARLQSLGPRICRVETPYKKGTGFLIGSDCVLTNFHVVEEVVGDPSSAEKVICRFDLRETASGQTAITPKPFKLAPNGIGPSSPYSPADLTGRGDPQLGELDYAVLRLAESVGSMPMGAGEQRGWFELSNDALIVAMHDFVVIPQHALGNKLEIAWGSVVSFPASGIRLRYDATTEAGSSGSPCCTADLDIVALHHAAEPLRKPNYNQAVPLWLVARDLERKNFNLSGPGMRSN